MLKGGRVRQARERWTRPIRARVRRLHVDRARGADRRVEGEAHARQGDNVRRISRGVEVVWQARPMRRIGEDRSRIACEPRRAGADRAHALAGGSQRGGPNGRPDASNNWK